MKTKRSILTTTLAPALGALLLGGCSDPSGPEGQGQVTARISDSPSAGQVAYHAGEAGPQPAASTFSGQMSGSAQVWLYSEAGGWVALGAPATTNLTLQSSNTTTVHGQASIPAATYTRVRLVLDGCAANIAAGANLGGLILNGAVSITVGGSDGRIEIEKSVTPFTVSAQASATVDFDLNSEAWVNQTTAQSKTASDTEVASATEARVLTQ